MRVCVAVSGPDLEKVLRRCHQAKQGGADLIEVRFDMMDIIPDDLTPFKEIPGSKIATLRSVDQGGRWGGPDEEKLRFLAMALKAGFDHLDVEHDFPLLDRLRREQGKAILIISYHDMDRTPKDAVILQTLVSCAAKGDLAKVAFRPLTMDDTLRLVQAGQLFTETGNQFVLVAMGDKGQLTRILPERFGSSFTYASLSKEEETAPGQIELAQLQGLREERIVTGVIGQSLSHSLSAWMHNAAFRDLNLPGIYLKHQVEREELEALTELFRSLGVRGSNVTIPYKIDIIDHLDRLDPGAERIGAVNTILNQDGELIGHNTDVYGVEMTFRNVNLEMRGRKALVVGAGGAARSVIAYLSSAGATTHLVNRTREKAEQLAMLFSGVEVIAPGRAMKEEYDAVVNCTPMGMKGYPEAMPVPADVLRRGQFVMDTIYNPAKTMFLEAAERKGARAFSGRDMLIYQAMRAFNIWTGQEPRYEVMRAGFERGLAQ